MMHATTRPRGSSSDVLLLDEEDDAVTLVADPSARATQTWEGALLHRLMRDVQALPVTQPTTRPIALSLARVPRPNVFETPPAPTDPPPPWAATPRRVARPRTATRTRTRRRTGFLSVVVSALLGASLATAALDPSVRVTVRRGVESSVEVVRTLVAARRAPR